MNINDAILPVKVLNPIGRPHDESPVHCVFVSMDILGKYVVFSRNCCVNNEYVVLNFVTTIDIWNEGAKKHLREEGLSESMDLDYL